MFNRTVSLRDTWARIAESDQGCRARNSALQGSRSTPSAPRFGVGGCAATCRGRGRLAIAAVRSPRPLAGQAAARAGRWYKGNTHTHTLNSDGDSTPDDVVRWYREHGYQFLVLTDHNVLTSVDGLNAVHGADDRFLRRSRAKRSPTRFGDKPIHINGLDVSGHVEPQQADRAWSTWCSATSTPSASANGIPHINHPNFGWAITADELRAGRNDKLFEIYNGHHAVNNLGGGGVPGHGRSLGSPAVERQS